MTRARRRALLILVIAAALTIAAVLLGKHPSSVQPRPPRGRPTLLLLTSLPLVLGEDFSLEDVGSPALKALQSRYTVVPVSTTDPRELAKGRLLLMAQPGAQTADNLVALDQWVRAGGRVMLLADPMLEWPSKRPLGDSLRPPPMFADTGLLGHWGLRLDVPDAPGPVRRKLGGEDVLSVSPGLLYGSCAISADRLVARCRLDKGRATVVADADLLDGRVLGAQANRNLSGLLAELATLEQD